MPDPIRSSRPVFDTCDPETACCNDAPPATALTNVRAVASSPATPVTIAPVVVTGDAGARELIRQYDSQSCAAQTKSAALACLSIAVPLRNAAIGDPVNATIGAFQASLTCGKELRALYDCETAAAARSASLAQVVEDCHARDGVVKGGEEPNEVICELP